MTKKNCVVACCQALMLAIEEAAQTPSTMTYSRVMGLADHYTRNYSHEARAKACAIINVGTACLMMQPERKQKRYEASIKERGVNR